MENLKETEEKLQSKRSPLMFESDEELLDDKENLSAENKQDHINIVSNSDSNSTALNEQKPLSKEEHLVIRLQTILTGIPPPPAVTVPQIDSNDVLKLWKANEHLAAEYKKCMHPGTSEEEQAAVEEAAKTKWPEVSRCQCMGVCFNKGSVSEELEYLSAKYKERYVGNETSSCVNSLYTKQTTLTASAKKRARHRGWGQSPGRRLSHLARRRKAFTSASFQSVGQNNTKHPEKKMILIDTKKTHHCKSKENSSKKRSLAGKSASHKVNSSKRALFQSPDDNRHRNISKNNRNLKCSPKNVRVQQSKRALWPSSDSKKDIESEVNVNGKRERAVSKISPPKKCNRSLFVNEERAISSSHRKSPKNPNFLQHTRSSQKTNSSGLSSSHRQKLLWAISNALREEGIRMNHELFRPCASVLFKTCQKLWLEKRQEIVTEGSTSENMLVLARQFSSKVVYSVEKDPSNTNLAELCSDLIRSAVAEKLEKNISSNNLGANEISNKQSVIYDNIKNHNNINECKLDSETPADSNSNLERTESLKHSDAVVQKITMQENVYKSCNKDEIKQNFVIIEDEETKFSFLRNDCNVPDFNSCLHDVDTLRTKVNPTTIDITVQPSENFSVNCEHESSVSEGFILGSKSIPLCSSYKNVSAVTCVINKRNIEHNVDAVPQTQTVTGCVLNDNDAKSTFSNLIKDNAVTVQSVVNNIPVSEMLSWNADPISRLKSSTTLDVFCKDSLNKKLNLNVMSHWQNIITRKELRENTVEASHDNCSDPKLDNLCSLESTVDTDCSSSIHSNTVTNYDFSSIIDDSRSWFQSDRQETYDAVHS